MSLTLGLAVYFMMWWIVLFAILPFWVKEQDPATKKELDFEGAPAHPHLIKKFLVNTFVTGVLFGILYAIVEFKLIGLNDIPLLPRFE